MSLRPPPITLPQDVRQYLDEMYGVLNLMAQSTASPKGVPSTPTVAAQSTAAQFLGFSTPSAIAAALGTNTGSAIIQDTWANLANYPAANFQPGQLYFVMDRAVYYQVNLVAGVRTWQYEFGRMVSALANQPAAGTLGVNDTGFQFLATDTAQHFRWTGTAWVEEYELTNAVTNTSTTILNLIHHSSGTPVAGFGASLSYQLDSSTNVKRSAGYLDVAWSVATNTAETADFVIRLMNAGAAAAEVMRVQGSGRVGIMTSTPADTLEVNGVVTSGNTNGGFYTYNVGHNGSTNYEFFRMIFAGNVAYLQTSAGGTGTVRDINISPSTHQSLYVQASTGNVGVATASPGSPLEVNGDTQVNGILSVGTAGNNATINISGLGVIYTVVGGTFLRLNAPTAGSAVQFMDHTGVTISAMARDDGFFSFGTFAAAAGEVFAGTVQIKDLGGNVRKVAIFA